MKSAQRVVWTEGLFITPQHLQQQDLYHEGLVATRVAALSPYPWGVLQLEIDREALAAGQLQLVRFEGIFPDGMPLQFEKGSAEAPPGRPVDDHFPPSARVLEVFLGLPREGGGGSSYGAANAARYSLVSRQVADQSAPASIVGVEYAQRNVRIVFGDEEREGLECVKIAEIVRDASATPTVLESYVPPCLRLDAAPSIAEGLRKLLRTMAAKQRELSDSRRHRDASSLEFTASDVTRYLQLNALNGCVPLLAHLVEAGDLHPYSAYLLLLQVAGQLSTFAAESDTPTVPKFQFLDLRATFDPLLLQLSSHLRSVAIEQCISVPLEQRGGMQVGRLTDERLAKCQQFILTVKSELPEQQVAEQVPRLSKIASVADIQGLVQAAAPGVPLQVTFRPPPEVPVRPGLVYFSLGTGDPNWRNALRDRAVAIYLPQPFDPQRTKLELLAVPSNR